MDSEEYVALGIQNPKSPSNMGSVMRAAGCFRADAVYYTGVRYERAAPFHTDTHAAATTIPLARAENLLEVVDPSLRVVCVELVEGAVPLPDYCHPDKALYVFGPEDGSVDQGLVDRADDVVFVPTHLCMNLAASVNVLLYDRLAKRGTVIANDALVRASRDTNNRLRCKG